MFVLLFVLISCFASIDASQSAVATLVSQEQVSEKQHKQFLLHREVICKDGLVVVYIDFQDRKSGSRVIHVEHYIADDENRLTPQAKHGQGKAMTCKDYKREKELLVLYARACGYFLGSGIGEAARLFEAIAEPEKNIEFDLSELPQQLGDTPEKKLLECKE